jgi:hypothetical protein
VLSLGGSFKKEGRADIRFERHGREWWGCEPEAGGDGLRTHNNDNKDKRTTAAEPPINATISSSIIMHRPLVPRRVVYQSISKLCCIYVVEWTSFPNLEQRQGMSFPFFRRRTQRGTLEQYE